MARKGNVFLMASVFALALCAAGAVPGQAKVPLKGEDCAKCHEQQPADIEAGGGKHKTEISCQDCHAGHRPASKNNIPQCSDCHEGERALQAAELPRLPQEPAHPEEHLLRQEADGALPDLPQGADQAAHGVPEQAHAAGLLLLPRRPRQEARLHPVPQAARRDDDGGGVLDLPQGPPAEERRVPGDRREHPVRRLPQEAGLADRGDRDAPRQGLLRAVPQGQAQDGPELQPVPPGQAPGRHPEEVPQLPDLPQPPARPEQLRDGQARGGGSPRQLRPPGGR